MINSIIDNLTVLIKNDLSILEACKYIGITIPKFCYHPSLSIAGNCRMCLVELQKTAKPVVSCSMPVINNMIVFTTTPLVKKARENVLETLLINHPLDCPICDQGGECDLQDETKTFGVDVSRFFFNKRNVEDKNCGLIIKTIMTRCIHCTRCVRFTSEITGDNFFGTLNRGNVTEISNYIPKSMNSFLSGNIIDLCPVGALTSKNYAFKARAWELKSVETIDLTDGSGMPIYLHYKESEIIRVLPKISKSMNQNWISDRVRFSFDSFTNSRLHSLFEKEKKNVYTKITWNYIVKQLKIRIKSEVSIFLINNEIDLESLLVLKKIINYSKRKILVLNTETNYKSNNYINGLVNKIADIRESKTCFLFFLNIYVENLIINTQLKTKYNQQKFDVFNFGNQFNSNFPVVFGNLSINNLISFFKSKLKNISKLLIQASNPLIILGESITNLATTNYLLFIVKKIISSLLLVNINNKCNTESLHLLNIQQKNTNLLTKSEFFVSIHLNDTLHVRKIVDNKKDNFWLNSHGSLVAIKNKYIVPVLNNIETNTIFLNVEQKPNQTSTLFTKINNTKSLKFFLKYILKYVVFLKKTFSQGIPEYKNLSFLNELLKNLYLFKKNQNRMSNLFNREIQKYETESFFFCKSVIKPMVEDFFLINSFCRSSITMNNFSVDYRKTAKNFYF